MRTATLLADLHAAEATLPTLDAAAARRLPERARHILEAIAALDRGDRAAAITTAEAIRGAGSRDEDVAAILDLAAAAAPTKGDPRRSAGPIPGLHEALASWRQGKKPRGSAALRHLALRRPALAGLLEILGRRRALNLSTRDLATLSPRLWALMVLGYALNEGRRAAAPSNLRKVIRGEDPVGIDRYIDTPTQVDPAATIRAWADDPRIAWTRQHSFAATHAAMNTREDAQSALSELLRGIHARIAAGRASAALEGVAIALIVAERLHHSDDLIRHLESVKRRLGALVTPRSSLPALLTLWRRGLAWPPAERLVIARAIADALRSMIAHGEPPPPETPFAIEAVIYLFTTTDDHALRIRVVEDLGMLLPEARVAEVMARAEGATRRRVLGLHALARGRFSEALDAVVALAQGGAAGDATDLLERALDCLHMDEPDPRERRAVDRAIAALGADPRARLEPRALPQLLQATEDLEIARAPIEALVRQQLAAPIADGDPALAEAILACALLGDLEGVQERVRGLGRWLRRGASSPDLADDLALAVLARLHGELDRLEDPEPLLRALAPLTAFVLREGPERALRACSRAGAASADKAPGYGAWAREHADRLGDHPYWTALIRRADVFDAAAADDNPYDDDDDDDLDIPF